MDLSFPARGDWDGSLIETIISLTIPPASRKSGKSGVIDYVADIQNNP
jgi:hypothetical protein